MKGGKQGSVAIRSPFYRVLCSVLLRMGTLKLVEAFFHSHEISGCIHVLGLWRPYE